MVPDSRLPCTGDRERYDVGTGADAEAHRGPEEAIVTWVWVLLAVWLTGVPLAVVVGRSVRLADQHDGGTPDPTAGSLDIPVPQDGADPV